MSIACLMNILEGVKELVEVSSANFLAESTTVSDKIEQFTALR